MNGETLFYLQGRAFLLIIKPEGRVGLNFGKPDMCVFKLQLKIEMPHLCQLLYYVYQSHVDKQPICLSYLLRISIMCKKIAPS